MKVLFLAAAITLPAGPLVTFTTGNGVATMVTARCMENYVPVQYGGRVMCAKWPLKEVVWK